MNIHLFLARTALEMNKPHPNNAKIVGFSHRMASILPEINHSKFSFFGKPIQ